MKYEKISNELKMLCADMVQTANSGHPGAAMGLSDIAIMLSKYITLNPNEPRWINRDRLVFSGGHVSALLYSLLHLWGFDISLQDLKDFRKLDSKTPGHPEFEAHLGIEITTGPLGQGIANAVGFALASSRAKEMLGSNIINHKIYCLCGDGDLQEGISYEACSLAGVHNLNNLIIIYDSNDISIEGDISIAFRENVEMRFKSQGFDVIKINGHDFDEIDNALKIAQNQQKPLLIIAKTKIAKNAHKLEGSHKTHGAPLGEDIIAQTKKDLNLPLDSFSISEEMHTFFSQIKKHNEEKYQAWQKVIKINAKAKNLLDSLQKNTLDFDEKSLTEEFRSKSSIATRVSNGMILNEIAKNNATFIGGSADLAPSNNTELKNTKDFPFGNNMHFGVREHAMGAICNAFANYGIFSPFCATFFVFSDYMMPSIRLAALMKLKIFYIFTHDSIALGEDGATHQPIEQLSHLRSMPNIINWRVCDCNENLTAFKIAIKLNNPHTFILSRQNLPIINTNATLDACKVAKGAYILSPSNKAPQISLLASGSEVHLALKAQSELEKQNISTQVISMPSFDLFISQGEDYAKSLFLDSKIIGIEALRSLELYRFTKHLIIMDSFGASGSGEKLMDKFGFNVENIIKKAKEIL